LHKNRKTFVKRAALSLSIMGLTILACGAAASAGDWPMWRGPSHNGISQEKGWLDRWPASGPPVLWKAGVGTGFSSFSVVGNHVYTAGNTDNTDTVFCLDADSGKVLWKHSYPSDLGDKLFEGGTTGTPTVDGGRVFFLSRWGDVFCFDAASGKVIWSKNVHKETGVRIPGWGFSGSSLVFDNLLILNVGEAGMALNKQTGEIVWKSADKDAGYSTPVPMQQNGKWLGVLGSGAAYLAVDLQTGKEAWKYHWLTEYGLNAADPIIDGDHVFISTGYGKGDALLKVGSGEPQVLYKNKSLHTMLNPAVKVGDDLYGFDGDASATTRLRCIEFSTGKKKWDDLDVELGALMVADGKLIVIDGHGDLFVAPASAAGFKPTARAHVLDGKCWTVPVLANGRIYCRNSRGDVVCLDVRKK